MSKTWKWILGILLVLVIVGSIVCAVAFHAGFMRTSLVERNIFQPHSWNGFDRNGPMMGGDYGFYNPGSMMRGYGFVPPLFGFGFALLRGLVPLTLLGLLVYGAYWFGKKKSNAQVNAVATSSESVSGSPAPEPTEEKTCKKCGGIVQEDWRNCPYCGTKQ